MKPGCIVMRLIPVLRGPVQPSLDQLFRFGWMEARAGAEPAYGLRDRRPHVEWQQRAKSRASERVAWHSEAATAAVAPYDSVSSGNGVMGLHGECTRRKTKRREL